MLNYMKSEIYRVTHSRAVYMTVAVLTALPLLVNLILHWTDGITPGFRYGTTSFSYSNIIINPMIYCYIACIIAAVLYESGRRNGNLRNTVAYGVSRTEIFIGKCIVSLITSLVILATVMSVFIGSAMLLLKHEGPAGIGTLLREIPAVSLTAVAALVLGILIFELFESTTVGMIIWFLLIQILPTVLFYMGLRFDAVMKVAMWFPVNIFRTGVVMNMSQCIVLWDTTDGMIKCLITGGVSVVIAGAAGLLLLRKRDLQF